MAKRDPFREPRNPRPKGAQKGVHFRDGDIAAGVNVRLPKLAPKKKDGK